MKQRSTRPLILLSNDDGIEAEGIRDLHAGLKGLGRVYVVAP
ncbi:5'/3'-nucleotidase SurE, partial [candidate division WOR-3 bacterium]|nr:5'/3'-nucleotidase SurE [candidate division WOR-3 bacterium]